MKKFIIAGLAAYGIVTWLLNRKKTEPITKTVERTHHLTKVFSKAKQRAINQ